MGTKIEHRSLSSELRAEGKDNEMCLTGYAALFGVESKNLGGFKERIARGAFTRTLKEGGDVKALVNHDANQVLGRTKNGSLKLEQDERGLKFKVQLNPQSQAHRDLHASVQRGDMDECSFAFTVPDGGDSWDDAVDENGVRYARRTLKDVNLVDVSPAVTYPAYGQTSVAARSLPDYISEQRTDAQRRERARRIAEQIEREVWADETREKLSAASASKTELSEEDRELQRRMASAAGRTVR